MDRRTVGEVGEIELVTRIVEILSQGAGTHGSVDVLVGPGDDAAVLACTGDVVITTDSQHEGVHFEQAWIDAKSLGRRAVAVNASDLGAMGARPLGFVVALAMPASTLVAWVDDLAHGLRDGAQRYGAAIVGGDVAAVPERVSINISAVGEREHGIAAARSGARPGQRLFVTGYPGRAAAGRELLRTAAPDAGEPARGCIAAFVDPTPPVHFGIAASERRLLAAVMDVSDGVALDLGRMCRASGVGAELDVAALLDDEVLATVARELSLSPQRLVLGGGEDYELLCAVRPGEVDALRDLARQHDVEIHDIGTVVDAKQGIALVGGGRREPIDATGWDHFSCR